MAPLEPWQKVLVSAEEFLPTAHGQMSCQYCHGGTQSPDKETAHAGLITDPSVGEQQVCSTCHIDQTKNFADSLHFSLAGYWTSINARTTPENHPALETMFNNHCTACHTTCSDCHISQPEWLGGGFVNGHVFEKTPSMTRNCTACHGSRIGAEYLGHHEGIPGDVHLRQARMNCVDCHAGKDLHDSRRSCLECHEEDDPNMVVNHRYSGAQTPSCESCHDVATSNAQHRLHGDRLSCQVCHSMPYNSCDSCHVEVSERTGKPFYTSQGTFLSFFIGRNPNPTYHRPYEFVPVRQVPIDRDSYAFYGDNLLPNYDAVPTWLYTTPHNIQRVTPQNQSCNNCHGNAAVFLTEDKVNPDELEANRPVIVDPIPAPVGSP